MSHERRTVAVAVILIRPQTIEVEVGELSRHGELHTESRKTWGFGQLATILKILRSFDASVRIDAINHLQFCSIAYRLICHKYFLTVLFFRYHEGCCLEFSSSP